MPHASKPGRWPSGPFLLALVLLTALAGGLRLHKLADSSFWNDELYTVRDSLEPSGGQVSKVLGYVPTRLALALDDIDRDLADAQRPETWQDAGVDKRTIRLPHAVIGLLTIPALMLASRRSLGEAAAILLGALLAVSAWHIYWSQAARFYILQFLFYSLALFLWIPATRTLPNDPESEDERASGGTDRAGSTPRFALAMACAFLAFWSQPVSVLLFGILGLDWLIARLRGEPLAITPARYAIGIVTGLVCLAMLGRDWYVNTQEWTAFIGQDAWLKPQEVILAVGFFVWPATAALVAAAMFWLLNTRPRLAMPLILAAALPPLIWAAMSLSKGFVGSRYAFICLAPTLAIAALALVEITRTLREKAGVWLAAAPASAILVGQLFATAIYFRSGGQYHLPMDRAADWLAEHRDPGETIYAHEDEILRYLLRDSNVEFDEGQWAEAGEPAWLVSGTGHSGLDPLLEQPGVTLESWFRLQQIHSRAEVRVYRYLPPEPNPGG